MKLGNQHLIFLLILLFLSCSDHKQSSTVIPENEKKQKEETNIKDSMSSYDTIFINQDSLVHIKNKRSEMWSRLEKKELIDSIVSIAFLTEINELIKADELFGKYDQRDIFYTNNIPRSIYKMLFSDEEIKVEKIKESRYEVDKEQKIVKKIKGTKILEERKYNYLYFAREEENYLLLILTKPGKYSPELELLSFDKSNFNMLGSIPLFGGIQDSSDVNLWYSSFQKNYKFIERTKVENLEFTEIKLDTTLMNYEIEDTGKIQKILGSSPK